MEQVNVFIVEDEAITVAVLSEVLQNAGYNVCGHSDDAGHALDAINNSGADIALLDINLTGAKDGVWLAEQINIGPKIPFIYLTSFGDKRTIERAVRTRPYGYLLKPFDDNDVFDAINLAMHNYAQGNGSATVASNDLIEAVNVKDYMFIRDKNLFKKVHYKDIYYLQADKNYIDIIALGKKFTIRTALKDVVPTLPVDVFLQINRSTVINLHLVEGFGPDTVMVQGNTLSLTDTYKEQFHSAMRHLL